MFAIISPALIVGAFAERIQFKALLLFVTAWSFFWNSSLLLISARFCPACGFASKTVLMACILPS